MITIGIDQSFTKTAFVVLEDGEYKAHEILSSNTDDEIVYRARWITMELAKLVDIYKPDFLGLESLSFSSKGNQTRNLGGLQFMIFNELKYSMGLEVEIVNINTLKKFATGNGKAGKTDMIESLPDHILDIAKSIAKTKGRDDFADAYHMARFIWENNKY